LVERELQTWRRMLPPTVVTRQGAECLMAIHVPHGDPVSVHVVLEDGSLRHDLAAVDVWVEPREVDGGLVGRATVALPNDLPMGWHAVHARSGDRTASSVLVVTPGRLDPPRAPAGSRSWGLMTQLYQVRSEDSWGIGDLTDLTQLAVWGAAELGADFVLVNPLHAAEPVAPITASPYLPTTRLYANPMYLRVEAIPEFAALSPESRAQVEALAEPVRRSLREDVLLDRDAAWTAKRLALDLVRSVPLTPERSADHARFRAREGVALQAFATWCALAETYGLDVAAWPEGLQHPEGELVEAAREEHQDLVDLQVWLQWVLEAQLTAAHEAALTAGMRVGVVHDLAVGVHPEGADAWALHGVLAGQCSVGAPPDPFNQRGQNWSQPPLHPERLAEAGYAPFRSLVRGVLRHAGGLRVDHVIGLFRMWWVPEGLAASEGTYVRYDHEALVGILALEAQRAGAVVIGEDLGVVEPWVRDYLSERGVLGTSISWFEKGWSGEPLAPEHWREACLGTVTTHDLPPTAGYLRGEHLEIREQLGLLTRPLEQERAEDERDREDVLAALRDAGLLDPDVTLQSVVTDDAVLADVVVALYAQLARTPCRLLGVALSDLVADRRAVNQPGTDLEYPNWRVPLTDGAGQPVVLDDLCLPGGGLLAHRLAAVLASRPAQ
ncbi:MAG TPA: 4-alpha-glucanotransferase, partial [Candidatus Limnocylindria bacterium]|nr:4-alpha-glucanotransferase [Candidatus Limnocylindria bacterium]